MLQRNRWLGGIGAALVGAAALVWAVRHHARQAPVRAPWPSAPSEVHAAMPVFPEDFGIRRVAVDPGHGAQRNTGNASCFCVDEQDFTLSAARDLARELKETGHFQVLLTRTSDEPVEYKDRLAAAEAWRADAFISLHSDVRGAATPVAPEAGKTCAMSFQAPGFAVLYSDEGDADVAGRRRSLARAIALHMTEAALLPYGGGYDGLYDADAETAGVFVDRHAMDKRIFVLRRALMPSVIIETHHALDPREAVLWDDAETRRAFSASVAAALVAWLRERPARSAL